MARPLRLEFPGVLYHVTARGNAQQGIYLDDEDRHLFLSVLAEVVGRFVSDRRPSRQGVAGSGHPQGLPGFGSTLAAIAREVGLHCSMVGKIIKGKR